MEKFSYAIGCRLCMNFNTCFTLLYGLWIYAFTWAFQSMFHSFGPLFSFTTKFLLFKGFTAAAADTATAVVAVITTALTLTGCGASLNSCHVLMNKDGPMSGRFDSKWRQK